MTGRRITLVRVANGEIKPAFCKEPILSSAKIAWDGILIEQHRLSAHESPEFYIPQHLICILLDVPSQLEWRVADERRQSQLIKPGDIGFIPANLPRQIYWKQSRAALYLTIDPMFIARIADELEVSSSVQLIDRWGRHDPQIYHIVLALKAELEAGGLAGRLYGEYLTRALAIHLLRRYTTTDRIRQDVTGGLSFQREFDGLKKVQKKAETVIKAKIAWCLSNVHYCISP